MVKQCLFQRCVTVLTYVASLAFLFSLPTNLQVETLHEKKKVGGP